MTKKAQSALEYLMTYGWAILIIVIVGAALYALGVFNPSGSSTMTMTDISDFQLIDATINEAGNVTVILGTKTGKATTVTDIDFTVTGTTCNKTTDIDDVIVTPSQTQTFVLPSEVACGLTLGDKIDLIPFTISYTVAGSTLPHSQSGSILKLSVQ
jgi:uncharacterized protein (UPF0333 family)